jgi:hypothetical protein
MFSALEISASFAAKMPAHVRRASFNACNISNSPNTDTAAPANRGAAQNFRDGRRSAAGPIRAAIEQPAMDQFV